MNEETQAIADCLRDVRPMVHAANGHESPASRSKRDQWRNTVKTFADRMATQNVNFDRARFETACGLDEE